MRYLDSNPRVAWANAFETGIRTQAMVDLAESQQAQARGKYKRRRFYEDVAETNGEEVRLKYTREQVSASQDTSRKGGPGAAFGNESMPVYSVIKRMEREQPLLAAVGHWLCLSDTGAANQHLDDVAEAILARYIELTPEWTSYRKARKERVEALIQARMMQDRNDMDGSRPLWQPKEIAFYCVEFMGVKIVSTNWKKDGWDQVWAKIGNILIQLESDAMGPIADVVRKTNRLYRYAA